jgi:hypothetical protein
MNCITCDRLSGPASLVRNAACSAGRAYVPSSGEYDPTRRRRPEPGERAGRLVELRRRRVVPRGLVRLGQQQPDTSGVVRCAELLVAPTGVGQGGQRLLRVAAVQHHPTTRQAGGGGEAWRRVPSGDGLELGRRDLRRIRVSGVDRNLDQRGEERCPPERHLACVSQRPPDRRHRSRRIPGREDEQRLAGLRILAQLGGAPVRPCRAAVVARQPPQLAQLVVGIGNHHHVHVGELDTRRLRLAAGGLPVPADA